MAFQSVLKLVRVGIFDVFCFKHLPLEIFVHIYKRQRLASLSLCKLLVVTNKLKLAAVNGSDSFIASVGIIVFSFNIESCVLCQ